jgi:DNA-binding CsgD family transcriptional regulator
VRGWALADVVDAAVNAERDLGKVREFIDEWEPIAARSNAGHLRVQVAYWTWLRRRRHTTESRAPLREAADAFTALGATRLADRALRELRASGETVRRRRPEARDQLTPQELQIAQLAADGLTNREIGERLYISHRTVGSHLSQLFAKLGVASRTELRAVLEPAP